MTPPTSFGLWIRQRRRLLDLTQDALAAKVGCSLSAIRKIEADERRPSRQVAELLADALQIQAAERATFLRIARMELRVDALEGIGAPPPVPIAALVAERPAALPVLPAALPAPAPPAIRFPLPTPPTPLVGREVELLQIAATLSNDECRLLTLVGPGGIGKSRLALAVAERMRERFDDGVLFVALAAVPTVERMASAMASALGVGQYGHEDPLRQVEVFLRDKRLLLVLDNMEHLLDGGEQVVSGILRHAPEVTVLATSREQLNLHGEWLFSVRGLSVPERSDGYDRVPAAGAAAAGASADGVAPDEAEMGEASSAVRLFMQSARRANVAFAPTLEDRRAIVRICRLVEGMPLAIELAASWVRVLTCSEIAAETERDWGFLSGSARDMPARHRSLRAVFDQSWALLGEEERRCLCELSVFHQGFRRDAAEAVAGARLLDLSSLVAKSLLQPLATPAGDRFELQEMVRQYAAEQLAAGGTQPEVMRRHAVFYAARAEQLEPQLHGPQQGEILNRFAVEHANLRAALEWCARNDAEMGLRLCAALWWFWFVRGHWRESRHWQTTLLAATEGAATPIPARTALLVRAANMAWLAGDLAQAAALAQEAEEAALHAGDERNLTLVRYVQGQLATHSDAARSTEAFEQSLALARRLGDRWAEARALYRLGVNAYVDDNLKRARDFYAQALAIFRALGDTWGTYAALSDAGGVSRRAGDFETAQRVGEESLALCRTLGFRQGVALELLSLGVVAWALGAFDAARGRLNESRRAFAEIDNKRGMAEAHYYLGHTELCAGNRDEARVQFEHALANSREAGFAPSIAVALHGLARVELVQGQTERCRALLREALDAQGESSGLRFMYAELVETVGRLAAREGDDAAAARLLGVAGALRERYAARRAPVEEADYSAEVAALRARLGDAPFQSHWSAGAALAPDAALAAARAVLGAA